ncbi:DUF2382 domain-containing protein [Corynebacterium halotolerans]|uniref:DUF2382 domain-containing protein n=1 Tax=Corynebacterium halotolerans YIM 70093 = DSM 44683 TaxID=1121362 RepID=M1NVL9_9CORY|nr:PRC and DUF2382 domain-containing protein [Corynebacterium halotolerans]AGF73507.1 hypothetical protein A605_12555 [Corynebacterium halotolerans YIM 70093 = DSM 44683]
MVNRNVRDLTTATAYDKDGEKLGSVKEVYINDASGQPDFVEVGHGLFGMGSSLVPLRGHRLDGENLNLAFSKERIKDAPNIDADAHLSAEEQDTIYRHYGLEGAENVESYEPDRGPGYERRERDQERETLSDPLATRGTDADPYAEANTTHDVPGGMAAGAGVAGTGAAAGLTGDRDEERVDRDRVGGEGDEIVRSEEHLQVDKDRVNTGQARLRKYVVHDTETVEVPVEREEVHVERTPVDADDARARTGGELTEDEASVTLHEERVNVSKEAQPVEKVRLEKDTVRDTEQVTEDVAKERIEAEGVGGTDRDRTGGAGAANADETDPRFDPRDVGPNDPRNR